MSGRCFGRRIAPVFLAVLVCSGTLPLEAQWIEDPIVPRGEIFLRGGGAAQAVDEIYAPGSEGRVPLGAAFRLPQVGVAEAPQLEPLESRIRSLAGNEEAPGLILGATRARFSVDEQVLPLGLSYGVLDRLTVGMTVPVIRKRIDGVVRVGPDGANVGANPGRTDPEGVAAFLSGAGVALAQVEQEVEATCQAQGSAHPDCEQGMAFIEEADTFLSEVGLAYAEDILFPLAGSSLAGFVSGRWGGLLDGFAAWNAQAPTDLPLAMAPLGNDAFQALVVEPGWPQPGFPLEAPPSFLELGDIELHAALGLVRQDAPDDGGIGLRSAVVGTLRLPTGQPDSLRHVMPTGPPRGVGGVEVRWVSDLLLPYRLAVLGLVEAGWHGSREMTLLVPDVTRPFSPGDSRAEVDWQPGAHLRLGITPRFRIASVLSVGAGWSVLRRGADTFEPRDESGIDLPSPREGHTLHSLALELRYTARHGPIADRVPLPFELFLRASRSVAGSGELAPVERRIEAGAHFRIRE